MSVTDVSVVLPVHDRADMVGRAVRSALVQDPAPVDIVVVDDGSSDGSGDAAAIDARVTVVRQEQRGRSGARNTGIEAARGTWVAFLDSDDTWLPGHLARLVAAAAETPDAAMVVGHVEVVDPSGNRVTDTEAWVRKALDTVAATPERARAVIDRPGIYTSAVMVRRDVLLAMGGFDEALPGAEDWHLWIRLARRHPIAFVPWPAITAYLIHDGNTGAHLMATSTQRMVDDLLQAPDLACGERALLLRQLARSHATLGAPLAAARTLGSSVRTDWRAHDLDSARLAGAIIRRLLTRKGGHVSAS